MKGEEKRMHSSPCGICANLTLRLFLPIFTSRKSGLEASFRRELHVSATWAVNSCRALLFRKWNRRERGESITVFTLLAKHG